MTDNKNVQRGGIGFWGALQLVLITLKLCGIIDLAWWVVLLPFEIVGAILVICVIIIMVCRRLGMTDDNQDN